MARSSVLSLVPVLVLGLAPALLSPAPAQVPRAAAAPAEPAAARPAAAPGDWRWDFGGRLHADQVRFDGVYSDDGRPHDTGYLRRAGVDASLAWRQRWSATLELEMDSAREVSVDAAWLRWLLSDEPGSRRELRAGRIDPDVGLEQATSSNWTWGIERSAIWDLAPDVADSLGGQALRADGQGARWQASAGLYDKRSHRAWATRAVWLPQREAGALLHLGLSLASTAGWRDNGRIRSRLAMRGVSEHGNGRRSTLAPAAPGGPEGPAFDGDTVIVAEAAWMRAGWSLQSEALVRRLAGRAGQADRSARGAYLLLARSLTGEPRRYDARRARFGAPEPAQRAWGGLEAFYRYDHLAVAGERSAAVHTLGLSWFAHKHLRLMANLHRARSDDANDAGQRYGNGVALRLQATL